MNRITWAVIAQTAQGTFLTLDSAEIRSRWNNLRGRSFLAAWVTHGTPQAVIEILLPALEWTGGKIVVLGDEAHMDFCVPKQEWRAPWVKRPLDLPELPEDKAGACLVHLQPGQYLIDGKPVKVSGDGAVRVTKEELEMEERYRKEFEG